MAIGVIGRKVGMTRVFSKDGRSSPVTVIEVLPNRIVQMRSMGKDGYIAVQLTSGFRKPSSLTKSESGHFAKYSVEAGRVLHEFRLSEEEVQDVSAQAEVTVNIFVEGQFVDVRGVTRGRGFAGAVKRHHFNTQDATHGNSLSHRAPGSIGQNQSPGRVFPGKKMAGHLGNVSRCQSGLEVVRVDAANSCLLVRGGVPGFPGSTLYVTNAIKKR
ncbi:50S ribosomal subunit protein L3 [Gammaproteobacteria bacterium]